MDKANVISYIQGLIREIEGPETQKDLLGTPLRFYNVLEEMLDGYSCNIGNLFRIFDDDDCLPEDGIIDQIVVVKDIKTTSICRHHLLPFEIVANVAYLPNKCIVGASKIPRLVNAYSHRLQVQERITRQVADAITKYLKPHGVAVVISGKHSCMRCRGVKSLDSEFVTSVMLGAFRENSGIRLEVLSLLGF